MFEFKKGQKVEVHLTDGSKIVGKIADSRYDTGVQLEHYFISNNMIESIALHK